jgi:hypothetical protein
VPKASMKPFTHREATRIHIHLKSVSQHVLVIGSVMPQSKSSSLVSEMVR